MSRPLFIVWQKRNETDLPLIDEQHKGILSIINTFHYLMGEGVSNMMLYSSISDTMKNYSRLHFIAEESFLEEIGYNDIERHKELHRRLTLDIERMEYKAIRANDAMPLLEFLKNWWTEHINKEDQCYARYLRSRTNYKGLS